MVKITMNAQAGYPVWGQRWSRPTKRRVVGGIVVAWLSLWVWAAASTMRSCFTGSLKTNQLRVINLMWVLSFPAAGTIVGLAWLVKRFYVTSQSVREAEVSTETQWSGKVVI